jgi:valyl-tRNA synthetase
MLGDTAVAVNPRDERFKAFIGQTLILPIVGREIPVIADDFVDPEFGTGAVKVTPAHDSADFQMGLRHNLARVNIMNDDASMNENAGEYEGMDRYECREALLEELREKKLLDATQPYTHSIGHCYRCRTVLEPYLSDQWFVKMRPLADAALKAAAKGKVRLHPQRWQKVYESWLENVRDWCISRQLWWGHRIPAWYCGECGKVTVSRADPECCGHCRSKEIRQDEDVLDTWFSSDLWPFGVLGWPEVTPLLKTYYPTSVLVTGRDIIYLWVARMVTMGLEMVRETPFDDVYIHGTILDDQGRRMSKSLGNGIDPLDIIEKYGADAMRFTLVTLTVEGQDVKLNTEKFEMGRNFANKIWNASRFSLTNLAAGRGAPAGLPAQLEIEDRWILSRLQAVVATATGALEKFQFNEAVRATYEFAWREFCDWYLEIIKPRLAESSTPSPVRNVLAHVLDTTLRLLHPFMPHLSEEAWQLLRARIAEGDLDWPGATFPETIMLAPWPAVEAAYEDADAESTMKDVQAIICSVRELRKSSNIPERKFIDIIASPDSDTALRHLKVGDRILKQLGYFNNINAIGRGDPHPLHSATATILGFGVVYVPLVGLLDKEVERDRLQKKIEQKENYVTGLLRKLSEPKFLERAPAQVVAKEKARCAEIEEEIAKLRASLEELERR